MSLVSCDALLVAGSLALFSTLLISLSSSAS